MLSGRILVVDDEPTMLRSVERILAADHEVKTSSSPTKALDLARDFRPQVAIVDIRMEKMDGFEVMNALKEIDRDIDVILMTGSVYDVDDKLIRAIREKAFYYITKPFDREVLRTLVERCLELRSMGEANRRHMVHLESQLAEARAFQETMLPPAEAEVEGFKIRALHRPSAELAGDLYDYAAAGPESLALLIADVVGHGVSAAMLTAIVKSAFHSSGECNYDPLAVVRRVREGIAAFGPDRFVTLLCIRISRREGSIEYVNAGHDGGIIVLPGGGSMALASSGPLIAPALNDLVWNCEKALWRRGSVIVLYTDGVSEALDQGEPSGGERVRSIAGLSAKDCREVGPTLFSEIDRSLRGSTSTDDMTVITAW